MRVSAETFVRGLGGYGLVDDGIVSGAPDTTHHLHFNLKPCTSAQKGCTRVFVLSFE